MTTKRLVTKSLPPFLAAGFQSAADTAAFSGRNTYGALLDDRAFESPKIT
jgi:hypothetical protein